MADRDDYWFFQSGTAPAFLAAPQGEAWWLLWGHAKDAWREGAREATKASLPLLAAPDSLTAYAVERSTERYPTETEAAYRVRLAETHDRYKYLGTVTGMLAAVNEVAEITDAYYKSAYVWDFGSSDWARYWLICTTTFDPPVLWGDPGLTFGGDSSVMWGLVASVDSIGFLRRQIARWNAAHSKLVWCALKIGGAHVFGDPGIFWGDPGMAFGDGAVALLES